MNIESYVKTFNNWIDDKHIELTIEELELDFTNWRQHTYYNPNSSEFVPLNGKEEFDCSWDILSSTPYIMKRIHEGVAQYIRDLDHFCFPSLAGQTEVRFNKYTEQTLMSDHCDHIHSIFDGTRKGIPALTILILLNEEFTGGEFVMFGDKIVPFKKGDMIVFPSNFLYPHRVNKIISGTRYSCVSWVY